MLNLQTEDSIAPVTCNGPGKPLAKRPFLDAPYHGWISMVSFFDHDLPDFAQDGLVVTANGDQAQPDQLHHASDFPAYWDGDLRQYLYYDGHNGYDYDLWYQPVYAAAAGKVIFSAYEYPDAPDHGYGQMVMIDHGNGYVTLYGHFSKLLVHTGQRVKRGQKIGISGNTGHSSGPHLHFTVFHNCSPTDPYGWMGGGSDPLQSYHGETSEYLWRNQPLVLNPLPGWPGLASLPPASFKRYLLLRLPSITGGTPRFTRALAGEIAAAQRSLGRYARFTRADPAAGALLVDGPVPATALYAVPAAVSIASPDVLSDARADLLAALAGAALLAPHHAVSLAGLPHWSGFAFSWHGRTVLVGRGEKGKALVLHLKVRGHAVADTVQTSPTDGSYAVDLGRVTPKQVMTMVATPRHLSVHRVAERVIRRSTRIVRAGILRSSTAPDGALLSIVLVLALLAALVLFRIYSGWNIARIRRVRDAGKPES